MEASKLEPVWSASGSWVAGTAGPCCPDSKLASGAELAAVAGADIAGRCYLRGEQPNVLAIFLSIFDAKQSVPFDTHL